MADALIQPKQWTQIEARNPRAAYRSTSDLYLWNIEVDEQTWLSLKRLPKNAILDLLIRHHDGELKETDTKAEDVAAVANASQTASNEQQPAKEKAPKKVPKAKGLYGAFWQELFKPDQRGCNFFTHPGVRHAVGAVTEKEIKEKLYQVFNVSSLTFVEPDQLREWLIGLQIEKLDTALSHVASAEARAAG